LFPTFNSRFFFPNSKTLSKQLSSLQDFLFPCKHKQNTKPNNHNPMPEAKNVGDKTSKSGGIRYKKIAI